MMISVSCGELTAGFMQTPSTVVGEGVLGGQLSQFSGVKISQCISSVTGTVRISITPEADPPPEAYDSLAPKHCFKIEKT